MEGKKLRILAKNFEKDDLESWKRICKKTRFLNSDLLPYMVENAEKFDVHQIAQIRLGFEHHLSIDQIVLYADYEFGYRCMFQIRLGFEQFLSMEQVKLYAKKEFDNEQMYQIRKGLDMGFSESKIKFFSKKEFTASQMSKIKHMLVQRNLPVAEDELFEMLKKGQKDDETARI